MLRFMTRLVVFAMAAAVFTSGRSALAQEARPREGQVQVADAALWELGRMTPRLLHEAVEKLASDPRAAHDAAVHAASILELQSALGRGGPEGERVAREAAAIRTAAAQIARRQVLDREELGVTFAGAALAAAALHHHAAEQALSGGDERLAVVTVQGAADHLAAAQVLGELEPSSAATRAIAGAHALAEGGARPAAAGAGGMQRLVADLGQAIRAASAEVAEEQAEAGEGEEEEKDRDKDGGGRRRGRGRGGR